MTATAHSSTGGGRVTAMGPTGPELKLLDVGFRAGDGCGVDAYSQGLASGLRRSGWAVERLWWPADDAGAIAGLRLLRRRERALRGRCRDLQPRLVVWHYSAFAYGWRGLPHLAPSLARRLSRLGPPLVVVLHEYAYPWGRRGWRGLVTAVAQRVALAAVMRRAAGAVVTTDARARWLRSRWWLPDRPLQVAPVFSTVPAVEAGPEPHGVGVFGWGVEGAHAGVVVQAAARLRAEGLLDHLLLVGGRPEGAGAREWSRHAAAAGCPELVCFTGFLPPAELARTLAGLAVLVLPDADGPSPRKTTLAASLALGRSVIAFDGRDGWPALRAADAAVVVPPDPGRLAAETRRLLTDGEARQDQGRRAGDFYRRHMDVAVVSERIADLLERVR